MYVIAAEITGACRAAIVDGIKTGQIQRRGIRRVGIERRARKDGSAVRGAGL
jgi:hypothetical protein